MQSTSAQASIAKIQDQMPVVDRFSNFCTCPARNGGISSESSYEENFDARPTLGCTVDKIDAVHAGHRHVGDHQVNGALPLFANCECLGPVRGVQDVIAHRL